MMFHVPMCKWCGKREVGSFVGSDVFCSQDCALKYEKAYEDEKDSKRGEAEEYQDGQEHFDSEDMGMGDQFGEAYFDDVNSGRYDDDPSPYGGTYSEE